MSEKCQIVVKNNGFGGFILGVRGNIDKSNAPAIQSVILRIAKTATSLTIDCRSLSDISSAGLKMLLVVKKAMGMRPFVLVNVSGDLYEILHATNFDEIIDISAAEGEEKEKALLSGSPQYIFAKRKHGQMSVVEDDAGYPAV